MSRALRWAVGLLLAVGVPTLARPASAQPSDPSLADGAEPIRQVVYEERVDLTLGHCRLEEMKVQLALLADVATFPYYLATRASGGNLEVLGFVPNAMVKQLALELAHRNTFLPVKDSLKIQSSLSTRSSLRSVEFLQREGETLLAKSLGEGGRQMHLEAQPNGTVTVTGSVNSVEEKLAVSRLFHNLPGCSGVINQLVVQPVLRDGQRVVQVTKDGSLTMPETALRTKTETVPAPLPAPNTAKAITRTAVSTPTVTLPAPPPPTVLPRTLDIREEDVHLPSATTPTQTYGPYTTNKAVPVSRTGNSAPPTGDAKPGSVDVLAAPKVPASWSRGVITWESEPPPKPAANAAAPAKLPPPQAPAVGKAPAVMTWESQTPSKPPTTPAAPPAPRLLPIPPLNGNAAVPQTPTKRPTPVVPQNPTIPSVLPRTSAPTPAAPAPSIHTVKQTSATPPTPATRQAPVAQPVPNSSRVPTPSQPSAAPQTAPTKPADSRPDASSTQTRVGPATPSTRPPLVSPRRWPPAYDIRPPEAEWGDAGTMAFEEEQEPPTAKLPPPRAPSSTTALPPLVPIPTTNMPPPPTPSPVAPPPPPPPAPKPAAQTPRTHSGTTWSAWPIEPADLKQRVESMCGRLAKDVQVQKQHDGSLLVRVKVASAVAERQLTNKILTIPEITMPNVHLEMVRGK